jgi:hypothetical protein
LAALAAPWEFIAMAWHRQSLIFLFLVHALFMSTARAVIPILDEYHGMAYGGIDADPAMNISQSLALLERQNNKPALRILSVGASIMWGLGSSDKNGQVVFHLYMIKIYK